MAKTGELAQFPFTPKSYMVDGHRLAYLDEGSGPPVVMLHGNPSWSYLYRNLIVALRDNYRLIVLDHLGCGFSDKPQDYSYCLHNHIDNLERLLAGLGIKKCSLVVHDWGGAIGMGWAGKYPERVAALVVLNSAAFRSRHIPLRIAICRWPLLGQLLVRGLNGFAGAAVTMAVNKKMKPEVAAGFLHPYDSWQNRIAVFRFVQDIPLDNSHPSWQELVRIENSLILLQNKPMLICWGGRDFCFNQLFYEQWKQRFPQAEAHCFAEAGHYVLEDAFAKIAPLVDDFLKDHGNEL